MFSSNKDDWETPQDFFNSLNEEFGFTLDVCANENNAKCKAWFGYTNDRNNPDHAFVDGLTQPWKREICWMNPPYGRESTGNWIRKAFEESLKGAVVVCLIPARTDTKAWHDYCMKADEIRFIKGRLKFAGAKNSAPFPSAVVVFKDATVSPKISSYHIETQIGASITGLHIVLIS